MKKLFAAYQSIPLDIAKRIRYCKRSKIIGIPKNRDYKSLDFILVIE
ncbi:hypothetical protein SpAn4DRAFT_1952 [Sporomusa ovata]|uniref:Uncharacterized protein n=1 Tax=Sporomusa ovata TaxID=2378 RepID=A0A0U1KWA1_9FIRM|nr:hypothetical protein SpAn4DRAFT_1952 [Sporomusa ovata]